MRFYCTLSLLLISVILPILCQDYYGEDADYGEEAEYAEYYLNNDEIFELCKAYSKSGFYSSPSGRNYYIYCDNDKDQCYEAKCPEDTPIFNDGSCETETLEIESTTSTIIETPSTRKMKTTTISDDYYEEIEESEKPIVKTTRKTKTTTIKQRTTTPKKFTKTKKPTKTAIRTTTTETSETDENCPEEDNLKKLTFYGSKSSCSQYFVCYHGSPISLYCADNLHFNKKTSKCDFPSNADCKIETSEEVATEPQCKSLNIEYYEHPDKCNLFYFCNRNQISLQRCPYMHHFHKGSKRCIRKHLSNCVDKITE